MDCQLVFVALARPAMRFVDLFAGLGGFHSALEQFDHVCVFASELDPNLRELYHKNHGLMPHGDIKECHSDVPDHDILCAGFPCQPFSKAGEQLGFDCPQWGDLFGFVLKILRSRKPQFLIIENVPNLLKHKGGATWNSIKLRLEEAGYKVDKHILSPHMFGVPQRRERAIIVGSRQGLDGFVWPEPTHTLNTLSISDILDKRPNDAKPISEAAITYIETWQSLIDALPKEEPLPSFPIWAMEFGATYPLEPFTPFTAGLAALDDYHGSLGVPFNGLNDDERWLALPPYARSMSATFPEWKIAFIQQNRAFYLRNKTIIDSWLPKIADFAPSFQKLEWNWKDGPRDLWRAVLQFRSSGIRAKRPSSAPSLVALTTSQVPVIAWERRFMTPKECSRLQSLDTLDHLPEAGGAAFKALGNAVNVKVIQAVAQNLLRTSVSVDAEDGELEVA
jgi:DNA (cytosine-5)-methyltransferase 1